MSAANDNAALRALVAHQRPRRSNTTGVVPRVNKDNCGKLKANFGAVMTVHAVRRLEKYHKLPRGSALAPVQVSTLMHHLAAAITKCAVEVAASRLKSTVGAKDVAYAAGIVTGKKYAGKFAVGQLPFVTAAKKRVIAAKESAPVEASASPQVDSF